MGTTPWGLTSVKPPKNLHEYSSLDSAIQLLESTAKRLLESEYRSIMAGAPNLLYRVEIKINYWSPEWQKKKVEPAVTIDEVTEG